MQSVPIDRRDLEAGSVTQVPSELESEISSQEIVNANGSAFDALMTQSQYDIGSRVLKVSRGYVMHAQHPQFPNGFYGAGIHPAMSPSPVSSIDATSVGPQLTAATLEPSQVLLHQDVQSNGTTTFVGVERMNDLMAQYKDVAFRRVTGTPLNGPVSRKSTGVRMSKTGIPDADEGWNMHVLMDGQYDPAMFSHMQQVGLDALPYDELPLSPLSGTLRMEGNGHEFDLTINRVGEGDDEITTISINGDDHEFDTEGVGLALSPEDHMQSEHGQEYYGSRTLEELDPTTRDFIDALGLRGQQSSASDVHDETADAAQIGETPAVEVSDIESIETVEVFFATDKGDGDLIDTIHGIAQSRGILQSVRFVGDRSWLLTIKPESEEDIHGIIRTMQLHGVDMPSTISPTAGTLALDLYQA